MACNCRKKSSTPSRSVIKKTGIKVSPNTPINRNRGGIINGRRIITRTIK